MSESTGPSVAILRSNHVGFTVADLPSALRLFVDLFGYRIESIGGRSPQGVARLTGVPGADIMVAHLHRDGFIGVELIAYEKPDDAGRASGRPCDSGYTHLTFDVDNLDALVSAAAAYGLCPVGEAVGDHNGSGISPRVVYLRDSNGINIELIQPARHRQAYTQDREGIG